MPLACVSIRYQVIPGLKPDLGADVYESLVAYTGTWVTCNFDVEVPSKIHIKAYF